MKKQVNHQGHEAHEGWLIVLRLGSGLHVLFCLIDCRRVDRWSGSELTLGILLSQDSNYKDSLKPRLVVDGVTAINALSIPFAKMIDSRPSFGNCCDLFQMVYQAVEISFCLDRTELFDSIAQYSGEVFIGSTGELIHAQVLPMTERLISSGVR